MTIASRKDKPPVEESGGLFILRIRCWLEGVSPKGRY
jgi:hypothetical protein